MICTWMIFQTKTLYRMIDFLIINLKITEIGEKKLISELSMCVYTN